MPDNTPDRPYPEHRADDSCSVCGREDFRKCGCPWKKPFDEWGVMTSKLMNALKS